METNKDKFDISSALHIALVTTIFAGILFIMLPDSVQAQAISMGKVRAYQVSCSTSAPSVSMAPTTGDKSFHYARLFNSSTNAVYVGGSDVTGDATKGHPICSGSSCDGMGFSIDASPSSLYCRTGSGTTAVNVMVGR